MMLDIDMQFHKGVLFIRMDGELSEKTINKFKEVIDLITYNGISNVVYNLSDLKEIDCYGINSLLDSYELCKKNHGKSLLCNMHDGIVKHRIKNSRILNYMYEASDELSAMNIINL